MRELNMNLFGDVYTPDDDNQLSRSSLIRP